MAQQVMPPAGANERVFWGLTFVAGFMDVIGDYSGALFFGLFAFIFLLMPWDAPRRRWPPEDPPRPPGPPAAA